MKSPQNLGSAGFSAEYHILRWKLSGNCDTINYSVQGVICVSYLIAVLLGLVQGVTEFLPVSSTGHLALLQNIFHIEEADLMFKALLHLGTLMAVFFTCGTEVRGTLRGGFALVGIGSGARNRSKSERAYKRLALLVLLGTVPLVLVLPFRGKLSGIMEQPVLVGIMLLVSGLVLHLSTRYQGNGKSFRNVSVIDVLLVGLGQAVGAVPGISRSGCTVSAGLLRGFQGSFAVKFSLLLSVPSVLASVVLNVIEAVKLGFDPGMIPVYLVGMVTATISGFFSIRMLRWVTARGRLGGFAYYCWGAGIVALLLSLVA